MLDIQNVVANSRLQHFILFVKQPFLLRVVGKKFEYPSF